MRKTNLFGATFLALTASAWSLTAAAQTAEPAPAPAAPSADPAAPTASPDTSAPAAGDTTAPTGSAPTKKPMMHHQTMHSHGKLAATPAGNKAVEDLNAASLDAAKTGKPFVAPPTPAAAKMTAHTGHKTHHMSKPKGDATAPSAAPDDSSK